MKLHGRILYSIFWFPFLWASAAEAQLGIVDKNAKKKPTLVVLGTYHMSITTTNVVNNQVDDITSPERQKQVVELVQRLKKCKPTKIALECDTEDDAQVQGLFNQYVAGTRQLSKNETNQIGFRLAKALGHKRIHCIDWDIFSEDQLYWYEKYAAKDAELSTFIKQVHDEIKKESDSQTERLRGLPLPISSSISTSLQFMRKAIRCTSTYCGWGEGQNT